MKDVKIIINGNTYINPENNLVGLIVSEGDEINWSVSAHGCGERHGTITIDPVTAEEERAIEEDPTYEIKRPKLLKVKLSYRKDSIIYQYKQEARDEEPIIFEEGKYEVALVGAGGGGGGGCNCHKKHHSCGGCAAASGAYLQGQLEITSSTKSSSSNKYTIVTGKGGTGGKVGYHCGGIGTNGGDSAILKNGKSIIFAQGGAAGLPGVTKGGRGKNLKSGNRECGYGGKLQSYEELLQYGFVKSTKSKNGKDGCFKAREGNPGDSVYPVGNPGKGGSWTYRGKGKTGIAGLGYVRYVSENLVDYKQPITPSQASFISREILKTDSMEYSSYYQPYVIPYNSDDEITYFYSYDLIHEDDKRPDANIVGPSSAFYLNRSKSVTAKHQPSVMKNRWKENTIYKVPNMLIHSCKILFEVEMLKYLFLLKTFL